MPKTGCHPGFLNNDSIRRSKMSNVVNIHDQRSDNGYFGPARVLEVEVDSGKVLVAASGDAGLQKSWAVNAVPGCAGFSTNDEVLVMGQGTDQLYIIGVLNAAPQPSRLAVDAGVYASVSDKEHKKSLQIFSGDDELLFEFEPDTDRIRLYMDSPNLEVQNRMGDLCFNTAGRMQMKARSIELNGRHRIHLGLGQSSGRKQSEISLERNRVRLEGEEACIHAGRGDFRFAEMCYTGKRFIGNVVHASFIMRRMESTVRTLVSRARNVYQKVDELAQLKAGRVRALVQGSYHMKAEHTIMKAEKDYKVNADQIHLG